MHKNGPIVIIEDDADDQEIMNEIFRDLQVPNLVRFFNSCVHALDYLLTAIEKPFLIISDINLPAMTGLDLCREIKNNELLRTKSIPFVFLTTTNDQMVISDAYRMHVQGFFVKPGSIDELKGMIKMIIDYWSICRHPYSK